MNTPSHSRLSPSARYRWALCPASVAAVEQYKESEKASPAADDGTHTHTLLEYCLKKEIAPALTVGMMMKDDRGEFDVDRDRATRVAVAIDYIEQRLVELGDHPKVMTEHRVDPAQLVGRNDMAGTVDVHIIADRFLEVIDYKDGMNTVKAENNEQMEQYVFGILAAHVTEGGLFPFDKIRMTIIQPKRALKGEPAVDWHEFPVSEISERYVKLVTQATATDDPEAPFVPGEKQCKYCPHAANCSAQINHTLSKSGITFENLEVAKQAATQEPEQLSDEKLCELVEAGPMLRKLIEVAEMEALRRIQSGHAIAGLKVVRGNGRREWKEDEKAVEAKLTRMGMPKGVIWQTKLISPAGVEKVKWQKKDGTAKQLSAKQLELIQNELVSKSQGALTVVPASDRRESVSFANLEQMFAPAAEVPAAESLPSWLS